VKSSGAPKGKRSAPRFGPVLTGAVALTLLAATAGQASGLLGRGLHPGHRMFPEVGLERPTPQVAVQDPLTRQFNCQKPHNPNGNYHCYGPAQIRTAYGIEPLLDSGLDGAGVTIVIIDAFQNPTMASDLVRFDSTFGLTAPPSFRTLAPYGLTPFDPTNSNQVGWAGEIALDVEWAHAIAPRAGIILTLSPSDNDPDIVATERYVVQYAIGNVVSMSYGEAEQCMDSGLQEQQHALFRAGTSKGITFLAGSGDVGAAQFNSAVAGGPPCVGGGAYIKAVSTPASDPLVTGVGGTDLRADLKTGKYEHESVWNEGVNGGVSGGGFSSVYSRPSYQSGIHGAGSMRGVPDVALTASFAHGVVVAWGSSGSSGEFWVFSGTSVATPQWAALIAIADQEAGHGLGNVNTALYSAPQWPDSHSDFHDITDGNNTFANIKGYAARPGWDAASGLGSPIADLLVPAVARWP
jgi:subtilase family serine protease